MHAARTFAQETFHHYLAMSAGALPADPDHERASAKASCLRISRRSALVQRIACDASDCTPCLPLRFAQTRDRSNEDLNQKRAMPKDFAAKFRIKPGTRVHLGKRNAADASAFPDRKAAEQQSTKDGAVINEWQDKLYAEGKRALLVVLQGVDTAGKTAPCATCSTRRDHWVSRSPPSAPLVRRS